MPTPTLYSRRELVGQAIRRLITYTDEVTWFGASSVVRAIAEMAGGAVSITYRLYKALVRRQTLATSSGDSLTEVAAERGAKRRGKQRARLLVVFVPHSSTVTAITVALTTKIEVEDGTPFAVGDSIRIRNKDGSTTERIEVIGKTTGTGPNGNAELEVASLTFGYTVSGDDIQVLLRHDIALETVVTTDAGVGFATTEAITIGDFNPVLSGESSTLALADKVWCEALINGAVGNVDPQSVSGLEVDDDDVKRVYNPERGFGGAEEEDDFDLRYRAAHRPGIDAQETTAWIEALAVKSDREVLRATTTPAEGISTLAVKVLASNGGPLSDKRLAAVENYIAARVRSYMSVSATNVDLVAIEVEAQVQLDPDVTLRRAWVDASARIANYVDYRRWDFETEVDDAELMRLVKESLGVRSVVESTFLPADPVAMPAGSLPVFVRLSMQDIDTGNTINGALAVSFDDETET